MSIFNRRNPSEIADVITPPDSGRVAQVAAPTKPSKMTPPFVSPVATPRGAAAPGVVPPPAAPVYSTRPPELPPRLDVPADSPLTETLGMAKEALDRAQVSLEGSVRVAAQRSATSTSQYDRRRSARMAVAVRPNAPARHRRPFDPSAAAQAGLLNLAWRWQEAGSPIRAIHTYMELLCRYPHTPAADAAVADLVELSEKLAEHGQFHTALAIYDHLEHLA